MLQPTLLRRGAAIEKNQPTKNHATETFFYHIERQHGAALQQQQWGEHSIAAPTTAATCTNAELRDL
jgi:hypothetical protein